MEQIALLRCLIRHHGLKTFFCEGLTPGELSNYCETVAVLREMEQKDIPRIKRNWLKCRKCSKGWTRLPTATSKPEASRGN